MADDRRLQRLTKICLALPETTCERAGSHATYRVRKKPFAYFLDDHHGDGKIAVLWKAELGENRELAEADPKRFYVPAYVGPRGWAALRLDVGAVDWDEVSDFVTSSYCSAAPRKLAAKLARE